MEGGATGESEGKGKKGASLGVKTPPRFQLTKEKEQAGGACVGKEKRNRVGGRTKKED